MVSESNSNIGILTLPLGHNYGGCLQAWALSQVIQKEFGAAPIVINRRQN